MALQEWGVRLTMFVGFSLYLPLFLRSFQKGCFYFFKGIFFFLKKNACLLARAQLTPVFAYTLVPGLPYGFCTQALTAWLPHSFETKASRIYGLSFCFLFQSVIWFLENSLNIFEYTYVFFIVTHILWFLNSTFKYAISLVLSLFFSTHICLFSVLRLLFVSKMDLIPLTTVVPALWCQ